MTRKLIYVSGTRADFGLLSSTLQRIQDSESLSVSVCATGMHLEDAYGHSIEQIQAAGIDICGPVPAGIGTETTGAAMARAIARELEGMTALFQKESPDMVMVLGDRGEMLAGALAALHLNIPIVHLHGGELSGTVDEPVRHAISKLSHYHFTSTRGARERLVRMGEEPEHIFVTGAPGLDGLEETPLVPREELCREAGLDPQRPLALVVFHPVVQQQADARGQADALMEAVLQDCGHQALVVLPNADAGGMDIRRALERHAGQSCRTYVNLERHRYLSWLAAADVMVGNSSSGIIEAASFNTVVVNVGDRQQGRERSQNVIDVPAERARIAGGVRQAETLRGRSFVNVYGDGRAGERIVSLLEELPLTESLLMKMNTY